jgi:serine/threonine protein kinase
MIASGTRLGPYVIAAPIGAGGMGEVYKAHDPRLDRDVAVKVLPAGLSIEPERLTRFEQEARAAAALNHPNILAVYDIGRHEGAPYIVSELLDGQTLRERLDTGALQVRKAMDYVVQIAHGLAAAHDKGITHRDLKPENVFLTGNGHAKILDFGLAKLTQAAPALSAMSALPTTPPDTLPGVVLGTIGYMSPEQVRGQPADHRSDIFTLGVILYEMLSGRRAFRGETAIETMSAILKEDPPDLPVAERHIPPALARIVDRCVEKDPAVRFQSTRDLAFALEALTTHSSATEAVAGSIATPRRHGRLGWFVVATSTTAMVAVLLLGNMLSFERTPPDAPVYRTLILPPTGLNWSDAVPALRFVLSPDGRQLAFVGIAAGRHARSGHYR